MTSGFNRDETEALADLSKEELNQIIEAGKAKSMLNKPIWQTRNKRNKNTRRIFRKSFVKHALDDLEMNLSVLLGQGNK